MLFCAWGLHLKISQIVWRFSALRDKSSKALARKSGQKSLVTVRCAKAKFDTPGNQDWGCRFCWWSNFLLSPRARCPLAFGLREVSANKRACPSKSRLLCLVGYRWLGFWWPRTAVQASKGTSWAQRLLWLQVSTARKDWILCLSACIASCGSGWTW